MYKFLSIKIYLFSQEIMLNSSQKYKCMVMTIQKGHFLDTEKSICFKICLIVLIKNYFEVYVTVFILYVLNYAPKL